MRIGHLIAIPLALLGLALIEGVSSLTLFLHDMAVAPSEVIAERLHTRYDPELGWVGIPSARVPGIYGPGTTMTINGRGFRNTEPVADTPASGTIRIVCSGDSFTLGYGVDDGATWPALLAEADARLETINMGQGGYGIDQAYLWYLRDGAELAHSVHVFAFISLDFQRMLNTEFHHAGKPRLVVRDNILVAENLPVPERASYIPWLQRVNRGLQKLQAVKLTGSISRAFSNDNRRGNNGLSDSAKHSIELAMRVFEDLDHRNSQNDSQLLLVYLPTKEDYQSRESTDNFRERVLNEAATRGLPMLDLVDALQSLPPRHVETYFITEGSLPYSGAAGHYTEAGNAFAAEAIYQRLLDSGLIPAGSAADGTGSHAG